MGVVKVATNVFGLAGFDEVFHRLVRQVEAAGELDINEGPWVGWASVCKANYRPGHFCTHPAVFSALGAVSLFGLLVGVWN